MKPQFVTSGRVARSILTLFLLATFLSISPTTLAHEWSINGQKIKAKAVDFDGSRILLEDNHGHRKAFPINELNATDLQYVTNLLSIRNAEIQNQLQREQLLEQRNQLLAQVYDVWRVNMVAPNGEVGWRKYFASNSLIANQMAMREFPNARIQSTQLVSRNQGRVNVAPIIAQSPAVQRFNTGRRVSIQPFVNAGF